MSNMTEAAYSANFRLVHANSNLPVTITLRAGEATEPDAFIASLSALLTQLLAGGWNTREASLGPNQDVQEANAYIVGRSSQGVRIVHLFKPPLEKRTGHIYEEQLDKLPFRLTGQEPEYPVPGVNPQLPRDEQYLVRLPGTFQFIRTAQPARDGGMATKRYTATYYVPATMQLELQSEEPPATAQDGAPHATLPSADAEVHYLPVDAPGSVAAPAAQPPAAQPPAAQPPDAARLREFSQLCSTLFGAADADEAARYLVHKYTTALNRSSNGAVAVQETPDGLTRGQLTFVYQTVGNNPHRYQREWEAMKLGWLSRARSHRAP